MNRFFCIFKFVKACTKHNVNIRIVLVQLSGQLQPIHVRHLNIRQHHVRLKLFHQLQGLHAIGGTAYHIKAQIIPADLLFHDIDDLHLIIDKNHFILFHAYPLLFIPSFYPFFLSLLFIPFLL